MFKHEFDFDPTGGYTEEMLKAVTKPDTEPADFKSFWEATYSEAMQIDLNLETKEIWSPASNLKVYEIWYNSWDNMRIGGWIVVPENPKGGVIVGHGYGGITKYDTDWAEKGFATVYPCLRGFNLSCHKDYPWDGKAHVVTGIEDKDGYIIKGCTVDIWLAGSAILEMVPEISDKLFYAGSSFGGGMGALALPWDKRINSAYMDVPTFGDQKVRAELPSCGSGEAVKQMYDDGHTEIVDVLAYFDASTAATYIKQPVICSVALFDPCVIPPGQFAVSNVLNEKSKRVITPAGHFQYDGQEEIMTDIKNQVEEMFNTFM